MEKLIERLWRHFCPDCDKHLSDERLAALFCRDLSIHKLSAKDRWIARRHLKMCSACRSRELDLLGPRALRALQLYREDANYAGGMLPDQPRKAFTQWLELQARTVVSEARHSASAITAPLSSRPAAIAAVSAGIMLGAIAGAWFVSTWLSERSPSITANTLLVRAEHWEKPVSGNHSGVARQTIQIRTHARTLKRSVYWDLEGKRQAKRMAPAAQDEQLKSELTGAGVNWDRPISASDFQAWHDHQHIRADRITRSAAHVLTLTTTVPDGPVSEESLSVRETDFHPVSRTVDFRNHDNVEIAELDFSIIPWNAVEAGMFVPIEDLPNSLSTAMPRMSLPSLPQPPTPLQLDETELAARLILNQLHADTGEQIEIHRLPEEIEVDGLVETEQRKHELTAQLNAVPRLKVSIESFADLRGHLASEAATMSVRTTSLPDLPSPLEAYLREHGRDVAYINALARRISENALTISQESRALADLRTRFNSGTEMPVISAATLEELAYSHYERLDYALRQQRTLLAEAGGKAVWTQGASVQFSLPLAEASARNLALARELTQTNVQAAQSAESILAEMFGMAERVGITARETYDKSTNAIVKTKR